LEISLKKLLQVVVAGAALALTTPSLQLAGAQAEPKRIEVTAKRFAFEPSSITLKKGQPVTIVLTDVDAPHALRFRDLGLDIRAAAKGTGQVTFTPDKTGDFVGHCAVFCGVGHGSMQLTLHVVE
jgi:cytochrome c oxidase subunit 2